MSNGHDEAYKRLRKLLTPTIKGKFTEALLKAVASGDANTDFNVLALKDNLFLATAEQRYLDKLLAGIGFTRPTGVGIDDDGVRDIAIAVTNNKAVSNIFLQALEIFYGEDAVKAHITAQLPEPYTLFDGQELLIKQDGFDRPLRIEFKANDFNNIAAAKALEIATVISREAVQNGYTLYGTTYLDAASNQTYVQIFSGTRGPKSAIQIVGGSAQNALRFPALRPTTQTAGTQWTVSFSGDLIRYTWTGGADPSLQNVQVGDYVIISSPPFPSVHAGSFTVTSVLSGGVGAAYFEIVNPLVQSVGVYTLSNANQMRFYNPQKYTLSNILRKATIYEVNPYEIVVFLPATARIVKRKLVGGWRMHPDATDQQYLGNYLFNPKSGFSIGSVEGTLNQTLNSGEIYSVIQLTGSSLDFPDEMGFVVFNYGKSGQEGPVRYLGRPSANTLLLDSSYIFKKKHVAGSSVTLLRSTRPYQPKGDGLDYPTYLTGTTQGRIEAERLVKAIAAAGIFLNIIIVYPEGPGLNNIEEVYSPDP